MAISLAGDKELTARVQAEDAVEFFLWLALNSERIGFTWGGINSTNLGDFAHVSKTHNARIAAHYIQPAEMHHGLVHQPDSLWDVDHICLDSHGLGSQRFDLRDDLFGCLSRPGVVDDNFCAAAAEFYGHGSPDPTARPGDQGHFTIKAIGNVSHCERLEGVSVQLGLHMSSGVGAPTSKFYIDHLAFAPRQQYRCQIWVG